MNDKLQLQSWLNRLNDILKAIYPSYEAEGEIRFCLNDGGVLTLTGLHFESGYVIICETGENKEYLRCLYEDSGVYFLTIMKVPKKWQKK